MTKAPIVLSSGLRLNLDLRFIALLFGLRMRAVYAFRFATMFCIW